MALDVLFLDRGTHDAAEIVNLLTTPQSFALYNLHVNSNIEQYIVHTNYEGAA